MPQMRRVPLSGIHGPWCGQPVAPPSPPPLPPEPLALSPFAPGFSRYHLVPPRPAACVICISLLFLAVLTLFSTVSTRLRQNYSDISHESAI
ncbi:Hypothetical protein NTJ_03190 [Nesidiocoris tenuis]|uniref:Uncharacterized protein n=1 Tax=Nesidiocoris tenuis TaxID=355587 RepID=A0ABN7ADL8_9HEMI|nr:Hypothetical protein NTJ_03190 [Nesidiocoris tenuis]